MDDRPALALGLTLGAVLISSLAVGHFERKAAGEIRTQLGGGKVRVQIKTDGIFGGLAGQVRSIRVTASGFSVVGLPIGVVAGAPKDGRIGTLELHLTDFVLSGLPVRELSVRIPDMRFDRGLAVRRQRLKLTETGQGEARAVVTQEGLQKYLLKKFTALSNVTVTLADDRAVVEGEAILFFGPTRFRATGRLSPREGRYLDLTDAVVELSGARVSQAEADALTRVLNPVIDENRDLHLNDAVTITSVRLEKGLMIVEGRAHVPTIADASDRKEPRENHRVPPTPQNGEPNAADSSDRGSSRPRCSPR